MHNGIVCYTFAHAFPFRPPGPTAGKGGGTIRPPRTDRSDTQPTGVTEMTRRLCAKIAGLLPVICLFLLCVGWPPPSAGAEPIRIGAFLSVTGPASFLGEPELKTLEHYVGRINEQGGVLGRPLELIHYDVQHHANRAVTFVKRLIYRDQVDLIIGGTTTGTTMAAVPFIERAEIPFISLAGGRVIIEPVKRWVFKTAHTDRLAVRRIYEDLNERGLSNLGLLSGSGGFDKSCRENVLDLADTYSITIVADETHGAGDTDMTPQLTRIRNSDGVEAFLYCGFGAPTSIVARNFRQLAMDIPHYQTHGSGSQRFIEGADGAAEGVRLPAAAVLVAEYLPDDNPQKPVALAYKQTYEATFDEPVSTFGGHAYDGLFLAVDALERAGSTDKEAVRTALEQTTRLIGADGIFTMSPTDHMGLDTGSFLMVEVRDGTFQPVR